MIMLRQNPKKHNVRDMFIVKAKTDDNLIVQKIIQPNQSSTLATRNKQYKVPTGKVFKAKVAFNKIKKPDTNSKFTEFDPVNRQSESSDNESDDDYHEQNDDLHPRNHHADNINHVPSSSDSESDYLSPNEDQAAASPEKQKTPRKEVWICSKETPHHNKLSKLKHNIAATKIQTWYRKSRSSQQRKCKTKAAQRIHEQLTGKKPPEILRKNVNSPEYYISSAEDDRKSRYPSSTDDNILDTSEQSLEWDNEEQCLESSYNDEHNCAFSFNPLNLTYENGMKLDRVYNFDQVLAEQHSPPSQHTPNTSTPVKHQLKGKSKSKWKKFLHL